MILRAMVVSPVAELIQSVNALTSNYGQLQLTKDVPARLRVVKRCQKPRALIKINMLKVG
jgi:hypothetical protein